MTAWRARGKGRHGHSRRNGRRGLGAAGIVTVVGTALLLVPTMAGGLAGANISATTSSSSGSTGITGSGAGLGTPSLPSLPSLPTLPQLNQLPGLDQLPNLGALPELPGITVGPQTTVTNPAQGGSFSAPFVEPGVSCPGETEGASATDPYSANADVPTEGPETNRTAADIQCKPAGVSVVDLPTPNGAPNATNILYWDGLEGEENVDFNIVAEFGDKAGNDQSRILHLDTTNPRDSNWTTPTPPTGGAAADGQSDYLFPNAPGLLGLLLNDQGPGSGALFCSDLSLLANGEVLVPGGTDYYAEPKVPGTPYGIAELQGLRNTRIYNPATQSWYQTGADELRALVPEPGHPRQRQRLRRQRRHQAAQARLRPAGDGVAQRDERRTDGDLRPQEGDLDHQRADGRPLPAALPAPAPAARRQRLLRRRWADLQPRSASPTTRRSGTSPRRTTRPRRPGPTSAFPSASHRARICSTPASAPASAALRSPS